MNPKNFPLHIFDLAGETPTNGQYSLPIIPALFAKKRTVRTRRRRSTESSGPRKRAEAPRRRRESPRPPSGGSGGSGGFSSGGGGSYRPPRPRPSGGGGGRKLSPGMLILLLVVLGAFWLFGQFSGGSDQTTSQPSNSFPTAIPTSAPVAVATATPFVFNPPASSSSAGGDTWTVMLYQDADDKILEKDIYVDLNEAERVGSSGNVQIVAQIDRYSGGYSGDGNWTGTKRFYVTQDQDLSRVSSQVVADLGEVSMARGESLVDFVSWAVENYPADKYALILSDHGMGWPGGWTDKVPAGSGDPSIPLSAALGDQLYLNEIDAALGEIRAKTGVDKLELVGMDACLMGELEVLAALEPHARYFVASQETEPALGWAYAGFLSQLRQNPTMDGAELSRNIVDTYIQDDQRIVDDAARADLVRGGSPMGGLFGGVPSAAQVAQQMEGNITISAVDMAAVPELMARFNEFAFNLQNANQSTVAKARQYAQSFTSVFGNQVPPSYIDLGNFAQLIRRETGSNAVVQSADNVMNALSKAVIAERHGAKKPGATGVSIYFPNSQLYAAPAAGAQSYTAIARRFAENSLWDDFLAYHYTGRQFRATAGDIAVPEKGSAVTAPGGGNISVSPLQLSDTAVSIGQTVLMSADVSGENIGNIMLFAGFYDQSSNSIFMADTDFLESGDTREVNGIYYPDWGKGDFTVEFEWEPVVFAISDGVNSTVALFSPERYGVAREQAVYTVDGMYTFANGGETRYARLFFSNGTLTHVVGFEGTSATGATREIIPENGDQFTVQERWMDLDSAGKVTKIATQDSATTLTFGGQMFTWEPLDAAAGQYIIGFIVQDLDGNSTETYGTVEVR